MRSQRSTTGRTAACLAVLLLLLAPATPADAHGLVQRSDLPIPEWLFGWAAAVVLVVSFVGLAVLWQQPRLEGPATATVAAPPRLLPGSPRTVRTLDALAQAVALALLALVLWAGFDGTQTAQANLAPTFVFVVFWVGLVPASLLFGDVFRPLNPWRALGRLMLTRLHARRPPRPYPDRLGHWPATLGLLGFTWLELAHAGGEHPRTLATAATVYTAITLAGMARFGVEPWLRRGEAFSVYFGLIARLGPFAATQDGRLTRRRALTGLPGFTPGPGTIALLATMIGTVTFDGLSSGSLWKDVQRALDGLWEPLGLSVETGLELSATVGILACVLLIAGLYRLGIAGMRSVGGDHDTTELARRFVHALVPIAVAYVAAHYLTLLVFQGQAIAFLASDPLGRGWDLLGTATATIDYGVLSQNVTWYLQVAFVVLGHVVGLALAHDRALVVYGASRRAARSQYWMLAVMVAFTTLALWLLAQAGA